MRMVPPTVLAASIMLLLAAPASGQEKPYRWEDEAKKRDLSSAEIKLLEQNKFVISGEPYKQIFQPYLGGEIPVFITSDSLLAGFHVLLEESIYRLEQAHARKLPEILDTIFKNLDPTAKQFKGDQALLAA